RDVTRIAEHREDGSLIPGQRRTLELHCVAAWDPSGTGHAHTPRIEGIISCTRHVEVAARLIQDERIGVLVEHMRRYRMRRAARVFHERLDGKPLAVPLD